MYRALVVARVTIDHVLLSRKGPLRKIVTVSPISYPQPEASRGARTHLGRRMGTAQSASTLGDLKIARKWHSCHKLVNGTGASHAQAKSMNLSRNPNDILWMLLGSLQLSVVVLTLEVCKLFSTQAWSQQSFLRLEWVYL